MKQNPMLPQRKLTEYEQREITIANLCGVPPEYISRVYAVPEENIGTIATAVMGKPDRDRLARFYTFNRDCRKRNGDAYDQNGNAAHFYVAYHNHENCPDHIPAYAELRPWESVALLTMQLETGPLAGLSVEERIAKIDEAKIITPTAYKGLSFSQAIEQQRDSIAAIYRWINTWVMQPEIDKSIEHLACSGVRSDPYEIFLAKSIPQKTRLEREIRDRFYNRINNCYRQVYDAYKSVGLHGNGEVIRLGLSAVFEEIQEEMIRQAKEGALQITEDLSAKYASIDDVLATTLTQRQELVIRRRLGMRPYEKAEDYQSLAAQHNTTPKKIESIERKAFLRLRSKDIKEKLMAIAAEGNEGMSRKNGEP
ncbi:hypothetical protein HZB02_04130 [Candidatus Woesearchaeota archaeon]|nr:hypothetical protein [Candidatus Woesearchaeota archaeon]